MQTTAMLKESIRTNKHNHEKICTTQDFTGIYKMWEAEQSQNMNTLC